MNDSLDDYSYEFNKEMRIKKWKKQKFILQKN